MGCLYQRCQLPTPNWPRPSWGIIVLMTSASCLMYPVLKGLYYQIHSSFTGRYMSGDHSLALINCPNEQIAKDIARGILERQLAASVNIMPKTSSLYIWKGEIEESTEILLVVKTKTAKISDLSTYIGLVHPFEMPDFISIPIDQGNPGYLRWIEEVVVDDHA
ncbi:protein CutA homolog [Pelodytes ibericus]